MYLVNGDEDNSSYDYCQHDSVIHSIFLGLAVVKGGKKFHETSSHKARYKTALPLLEMQKIQKPDFILIAKYGNNMFFRKLE